MNIFAKRLLIGSLAIAAAQTALADRQPIMPIEGSVESTADEVSLPASESGIVTARSCDSCPAQTFYLDKQRELLLNGRNVGLLEMARALRIAGKTPVTVHYRVTDALITRIVAVTQ